MKKRSTWREKLRGGNLTARRYFNFENLAFTHYIHRFTDHFTYICIILYIIIRAIKLRHCERFVTGTHIDTQKSPMTLSLIGAVTAIAAVKVSHLARGHISKTRTAPRAPPIEMPVALNMRRGAAATKANRATKSHNGHMCAGRKCQTRKMPDSGPKWVEYKENAARPSAHFSNSFYGATVSVSPAGYGEAPFDIQASTPT